METLTGLDGAEVEEKKVGLTGAQVNRVDGYTVHLTMDVHGQTGPVSRYA